MAIRIVPYEAHLATAAAEFNRRLRSAQASSFPLNESAPGELSPRARACGIEFHHFLAVDERDEVRGGYFIRTQPFLVRQQVHIVGHYSAPLSEGIIDKRYAAVGTLLLAHAVKFQPLLFAMGMGGLEKPLPRMLKAMRWTIYEVPFLFQVLNGSRFFRNLGPLHRSRSRSLIANALSLSGTGHLALRLLHRIRTRANALPLETVPVERFGSWADDAWRESQGGYSFSAVRDSRYLQFLYGDMLERYRPIRLREGKGTAGWVQVLNCQPRNTEFFGAMRVTALTDGVAPPAAIPSLIGAAVEQAKQEKADLIFSNQMHSDWTRALKTSGFLEGRSNYLLALSKGLAAMLDPLSESASRIHFNRGDGDGSVNLVG
jgi:hypothetical protein